MKANNLFLLGALGLAGYYLLQKNEADSRLVQVKGINPQTGELSFVVNNTANTINVNTWADGTSMHVAGLNVDIDVVKTNGQIAAVTFKTFKLLPGNIQDPGDFKVVDWPIEPDAASDLSGILFI